MTLFKTKIWDNFGGQFTKNYGTQQKTNTTAMYINSILSIEATFIKITLQSNKQEDLDDSIWVRLSRMRKPIKIKVHFWKSEAFLPDPTNIARN